MTGCENHSWERGLGELFELCRELIASALFLELTPKEITISHFSTNPPFNLAQISYQQLKVFGIHTCQFSLV